MSLTPDDLAKITALIRESEKHHRGEKIKRFMIGLHVTVGLIIASVGAMATVAICYNSDKCSFRKNITHLRVQSEDNIVLAVDAVRENALPPPDTVFALELISLKCNIRHERRRHAPDEPFLKVMDKPIMRPVDMDVGHMVNLDQLGSYPFVGSAEIELWDRDTPDGNDDEYLGNMFARESDAHEGVKTYEFTGSGASYVLTYRVIERSSVVSET